MATRTSIALPAPRVAPLLAAIENLPGVLSVSMQHGGSLHPPGDVVVIEITNQGLHPLLRLLVEQGIGVDASTSVSTSRLGGVLNPEALTQIARERSEASWEEVEMEIAKESNMSANGVLLMMGAGVLAAVGLATSALHIVIAGMLIAPGFEPLSRIALRAVSGARGVAGSVGQVLLAYAALLLGAALVALALPLTGAAPLGSKSSYLQGGILVAYWTEISALSVAASALASVAGAVVIAANRSILTAGVMVALALVPTAALAGMGLALWNLELAAAAALRWLIDAALVAGLSAAVFAWKRQTVHKRRMSLTTRQRT